MYTIVIPTLYSKRLEKTLAALLNQTLFNQIDEIIVVGLQENVNGMTYKNRFLS